MGRNFDYAGFLWNVGRHTRTWTHRFEYFYTEN